MMCDLRAGDDEDTGPYCLIYPIAIFVPLLIYTTSLIAKPRRCEGQKNKQEVRNKVMYKYS